MTPHLLSQLHLNGGKSLLLQCYRVKSSPIRLTNMQESLFGLLTKAMHGNVYTLAESSWFESPSFCQVENLDATRFIFVSQTPVIGYDGCLIAVGNECKKSDSLSQEHGAIYNASHCEHRNRNHAASILWELTEDGLNISDSHLFMFVGCNHMLRLFWYQLLPHTVVCQTSRLKFTITADFFICALFKVYKNLLDSHGLEWTWLSWCATSWLSEWT